jgi:hypothetical protein
MLTVAIAVGLWWIDRNVLLSSFPLLSRLAVSGIALIGVAGSMFSAHLSGSASKDIDHEGPQRSDSAMTDRRNRAFGTGLGITIEVLLAVVRAAATGAFLTSIFLGAAGLALWAFARSLAYRHRSKTRAHLDQDSKEEQRARAKATACRRREVELQARHVLSHHKLIETAKGIIDHLDREASGARVVWQQVNPGVAFPGVSNPAAVDVWTRYAEGWLPEQLRIPARQLPSIEDAFSPVLGRTQAILELGQGSR